MREGVEAALIIGITLAYLNKIQRPDLRRSVFAALAAAFVASIGCAILLSRLQLNEDIFEGWVMLGAAFFVITMIVFMMKAGKKLKGEIEGKIGSLAGRGSQLGIFLCFLVCAGETVLVLAALSIPMPQASLWSWRFWLLCWAEAVRARLNQPVEIFRVTTVSVFVAAQLICSASRAFGDGALHSSKREMSSLARSSATNGFSCNHLALGSHGSVRGPQAQMAVPDFQPTTQSPWSAP